jgi:hypothetical protein
LWKTHLEKNYQNQKFEVKSINKTISIGTDSLEMHAELKEEDIPMV